MRTKSLLFDDDVFAAFATTEGGIFTIAEMLQAWQEGRVSKDLTRRGVSQGLAAISAAGQSYDTGMTPEQLVQALHQLAERYPELYKD